MENKDRLDFWRNEKMKIVDVIQMLNNIKREMNIQNPKKVLDRYIEKQTEALEEANEAYDYYLKEEIKNESAIRLPKRDSGESK